MNLYTEQFD